MSLAAPETGMLMDKIEIKQTEVYQLWDTSFVILRS